MNNKFLSKEELLNILDKNKRIALINGCFDLTHAGHATLLKYIKDNNIADITIVALNSDDSIRQIKGENRPIIKLNHRAIVLCAFEFVDYVTWFDEPTATNIIKYIRPHIIVKGINSIIPQSEIDLYNELNIKIEFVTLLDDLSTTNIINDILNKYC